MELRAAAAREQARLREQQVAAEQSPDNKCRQAAFAGGLMESFNDFDVIKSGGAKAIDIEHLTTLKWDTGTLDVICHGTFVLTNGTRLTGSMEMRPNVAGNMITQWRRDQ